MRWRPSQALAAQPAARQMAIQMAGTSIAQLARYMHPTPVVHLDMPGITGVHVHELQDDRHAIAMHPLRAAYFMIFIV